jgi:hypothetical protein
MQKEKGDAPFLVQIHGDYSPQLPRPSAATQAGVAQRGAGKETNPVPPSGSDGAKRYDECMVPRFDSQP